MIMGGSEKHVDFWFPGDDENRVVENVIVGKYGCNYSMLISVI